MKAAASEFFFFTLSFLHHLIRVAVERSRRLGLGGDHGLRDDHRLRESDADVGALGDVGALNHDNCRVGLGGGPAAAAANEPDDEAQSDEAASSRTSDRGGADAATELACALLTR